MLNLEDVKIGMRIKDAITDLEGVITGRCDHIGGYSQFVVQAKAKDGAVPNAYAIDWQAFEITSDELCRTVIPAETHPFKLGDAVNSLDTGASGIIARLWTYFNGCVQAAITLPLNNDGEPQEALMVPVNRLELIETVKEPVKTKRQGGPATRAPRC